MEVEHRNRMSCMLGEYRNGKRENDSKQMDSENRKRERKRIIGRRGRFARPRRPGNYDAGAAGTSPVIGPSASVCEMSPKLWKSEG